MPYGNITAAIADMAPRAEAPPGARSQRLRQRFLSAAVLLPVALGAAWLGSLYWAALVFLFALAMVWEWSAICAGGDRDPTHPAAGIAPISLASMLFVGIASLAAGFEGYVLSVLLLFLGAGATAILARRGQAGWQSLGVLYVGFPCIAIIWIRAQHDQGLATLFWLLALVMAVDTGAFAAGRLIGGPKLAPRISPRKTWAGLAGGVVAAMLIGWTTSLWLGFSSQLALILVSGALALVEQAGDLAESAFKRRFGVKDSSQLIPGHGGVLDRVDGLLAVSLAVGLAEYFLGGISAWTR